MKNKFPITHHINSIDNMDKLSSSEKIFKKYKELRKATVNNPKKPGNIKVMEEHLFGDNPREAVMTYLKSYEIPEEAVDRLMNEFIDEISNYPTKPISDRAHSHYAKIKKISETYGLNQPQTALFYTHVIGNTLKDINFLSKIDKNISNFSFHKNERGNVLFQKIFPIDPGTIKEIGIDKNFFPVLNIAHAGTGNGTAELEEAMLSEPVETINSIKNFLDGKNMLTGVNRNLIIDLTQMVLRKNDNGLKQEDAIDIVKTLMGKVNGSTLYSAVLLSSYNKRFNDLNGFEKELEYISLPDSAVEISAISDLRLPLDEKIFLENLEEIKRRNEGESNDSKVKSYFSTFYPSNISDKNILQEAVKEGLLNISKNYSAFKDGLLNFLKSYERVNGKEETLKILERDIVKGRPSLGEAILLDIYDDSYENQNTCYINNSPIFEELVKDGSYNEHIKKIIRQISLEELLQSGSERILTCKAVNEELKDMIGNGDLNYEKFGVDKLSILEKLGLMDNTILSAILSSVTKGPYANEEHTLKSFTENVGTIEFLIKKYGLTNSFLEDLNPTMAANLLSISDLKIPQKTLLYASSVINSLKNIKKFEKDLDGLEERIQFILKQIPNLSENRIELLKNTFMGKENFDSETIKSLDKETFTLFEEAFEKNVVVRKNPWGYALEIIKKHIEYGFSGGTNSNSIIKKLATRRRLDTYFEKKDPSEKMDFELFNLIISCHSNRRGRTDISLPKLSLLENLNIHIEDLKKGEMQIKTLSLINGITADKSNENLLLNILENFDWQHFSKIWAGGFQERVSFSGKNEITKLVSLIEKSGPIEGKAERMLKTMQKIFRLDNENLKFNIFRALTNLQSPFAKEGLVRNRAKTINHPYGQHGSVGIMTMKKDYETLILNYLNESENYENLFKIDFYVTDSTVYQEFAKKLVDSPLNLKEPMNVISFILGKYANDRKFGNKLTAPGTKDWEFELFFKALNQINKKSAPGLLGIALEIEKNLNLENGELKINKLKSILSENKYLRVLYSKTVTNYEFEDFVGIVNKLSNQTNIKEILFPGTNRIPNYPNGFAYIKRGGYETEVAGLELIEKLADSFVEQGSFGAKGEIYVSLMVKHLQDEDYDSQKELKILTEKIISEGKSIIDIYENLIKDALSLSNVPSMTIAKKLGKILNKEGFEELTKYLSQKT